MSAPGPGPRGTALAVAAVLRLGPSYWWRALALAVAFGLAIAIPTRLVPNDLFSRMTPTRPQDYAFWIIASALLGLTLALRSPRARTGGPVAGGIGTFLAVGCPICNKVVVGLLGVSGALTYFAPLQPLLGAAALVLLAAAFRRRAAAVAPVCPTRTTGGSQPLQRSRSSSADEREGARRAGH